MHALNTERTTVGTYAYCNECHNPDGFGVGRCDYLATDLIEAVAWFEEVHA
jgi:hypothetical protein